MACVIKKPDETKGVISFTSPEHREVLKGETKEYLINNRDKWIYLQHHNWQPCQHDNFYDSNLCNYNDLQNSGHCLDMDCCNFSPGVYEYGDNERFFDVIYVARCVFFKRVEVFFHVCKSLLQKRPNTKILFVCPIPGEDCQPQNPKQMYLDMFSREERKNFVCMFLDYDYPFTLSKEVLSHFYKSSKVFLHTSNNERHPRVCSYAWASGMSVVGYPNLSTFLPNEFNKEPYFYKVGNDNEYVSQIIKAIENPVQKSNYDKIKYHVGENFSIETLKSKLKELFELKGLNFTDSNIYWKNLDFRMGRHCVISLGDNSLPISVPDLMKRAEQTDLPLDCEDLEISLSERG
jgi:glycosyltransferase involved in cell wall biosynthesis